MKKHILLHLLAMLGLTFQIASQNPEFFKNYDQFSGNPIQLGLLPNGNYSMTIAKLDGSLYSQNFGEFAQTDGALLSNTPVTATLDFFTSYFWLSKSDVLEGSVAANKVVLRKKTNGTTVFTRNLSVFGNYTVRSVAAVRAFADGKLLLAAVLDSVGVAANFKRLHVIKTQANGALIWQKTYQPSTPGGPDLFTFAEMLTLPSGGFYTVLQYNLQADSQLARRFDASGKQIGGSATLRNFQYLTSNFKTNAAEELLFTKIFLSTGFPNPMAGTLEKANFATGGTTVLFQNPTGYLQQDVHAFSTAANGDLLVAGRRAKFDNNTGTYLPNEFFVARLSPAGAAIWERLVSYLDVSGGRFYQVAATASGAVVGGTNPLPFLMSVQSAAPPPPPGTCAGNLLQNPGFENGTAGWENLQAANIVAEPASGAKAAKICQNIWARQMIPASPGKNYTLKVRGKWSGTAGQANESYVVLKILSNNWQVLVDKLLRVNSANFSEFTLDALAPQGAAWLEAGFVRNGDGCLTVDDFCLTDGASTAPLPDILPKTCPTVIGFYNGAGLGMDNLRAGGQVSMPYCSINVTNLVAPNQNISFKNKVFLSTDNALSANDILLASETINAFPNAGSPDSYYSEAGITMFDVPQSVASGSYFLILKSDADNEIAESNENNNLYARPVTVLGNSTGGSGADLKVSISADKTTVPQWGNVTFTVKATNEGDAPIAQANILTWVCPNVPGIGGFNQVNGLVFAGTPPQPSVGTLNIVTNLWQIQNLAPGQTATLVLPAFTLTASEKKVVAWSALQSPADPDSQPDGTAPANCAPGQDDEAAWTINAGQFLQGGEIRDLENEELQRADFQFFPNPAGDFLWLDFSKSAGKSVRVSLLNQLGGSVSSRFFENMSGELETLDLTGVSNGQYFLKMEIAGERSVVKRLMVLRGY